MKTWEKVIDFRGGGPILTIILIKTCQKIRYPIENHVANT